MKKINLLFSLYSLITFLIIIERLSPTTNHFLPPYNFIRPHELIQATIFMPFTVILSVFFLKIASNNFQTLKQRKNAALLLLFVIGIYFYGVGEGWHEMASFLLYKYCHSRMIHNGLCGGLFVNDYYVGNILFFIGGILVNATLMALSLQAPIKDFTRNDRILLFINSTIYAFTWIAYAAFDKVAVGLIFSCILMVISWIFFMKIYHRWKNYPYLVYSAFAYSLATIITFVIKFQR